MNKQEKQLVENVLPKFNMNEQPYGKRFDDSSMGLNMMVVLGEYLSDEMRKRFDTYDDKIVDVITFVDKCLTQTTTLTNRMEKDIKGIEDSSVDEVVVMVKGIIG
jgi:hypothetical protein